RSGVGLGWRLSLAVALRGPGVLALEPPAGLSMAWLSNDVPARRDLAATWLKRGASARSGFSGIRHARRGPFTSPPGGGAVHGRSDDRDRPAQGLAHGGGGQRSRRASRAIAGARLRGAGGAAARMGR